MQGWPVVRRTDEAYEKLISGQIYDPSHISDELINFCMEMDECEYFCDPAEDCLNLFSQDEIPLDVAVILSPVSQRLPIITVCYAPGMTCRALCDSGASSSIMVESIFLKASANWTRDQWTLRQWTQYPNLRGISGQNITPLGRYLIIIRIEDDIFPNDFLIVPYVETGPLSHYGVILGIDFMRRHNFSIHCNSDSVEVNGRLVPLEEPISNDIASVQHIDIDATNSSNFEYELGMAEVMVQSSCRLSPRSSSEVCFVMSDISPDNTVVPNQVLDTPYLFLEPISYNSRNGLIKAKVHNMSPFECELGDSEIFSVQTELPNPISTHGSSDTMEDLTPEERTKEWNRVISYILNQTSKISDKEKAALESLIRAYPDVFRLKTDPPGRIKSIEVSVQLTTANPIYRRQYPLPPADMAEAEKQVKVMLKHGIISPTASPYNCPILMVPKKDVMAEGVGSAEKRMVNDLRPVNEHTPELKFPPCRIDEALSALRGHSRFSSVDFLHGFWQLPLAENSKRIFAFTVSSGRYHFNVMPFGWINAPAWMQNFIMVIFVARLAPQAQGYMDDLILYSKGTEAHFQLLKKMLDLARDEGAALKLSKCEFFSDHMLYLGHIVTVDGLRMDPKKTEGISRVDPPKNQKEMRSFAGSAQYFSKFILNFSKRMRPLLILLRKDVEFFWGPEQQAAFEDIKSALLQDVLLHFPVDGKSYVITTDASQYAIGAYLGQDFDGIIRPIWCISRTLNRAEIRYSTIEKELLAIVFALQRFKPYVYGQRFKIVTDHRPLVWLCGLNKPSSRLARWSLMISEYAGKVEFVPGKENRVADALSRPPFCPEIKEESPPLEGPMSNPDLCQDLKEQILKSTVGVDVLSILESNGSEDDEGIEEDSLVPVLMPEFWINSVPKGELPKDVYTDPHGIYWYNFTDSRGIMRPLLWVPPVFRLEVMSNFHKSPYSAHKSTLKMLDSLIQDVWWEGMKKDVTHYVRHCSHCQLINAGNESQIPVQKTNPSLFPFHRVSLDIVKMDQVSPGKKNKNLLVIVDCFSRFAEAYPVPNENAETIAQKFLRDFICRYGAPVEMITDQGQAFVGKLMTTVCMWLRIRKIHTAAYRPQGNAVNERMHRTLYNFLRAMVSSTGTDWEHKLPYAMFAYRTTYHKSLGMSPFQALFGYAPLNLGFLGKREWGERDDLHKEVRAIHEIHDWASRNMTAAQRERNKWANKRRKLREFAPGDLVKWRMYVRNKLQPAWRGPVKIIRRIGPVDYCVELEDKTQKVIHVHHLAKWHVNPEIAQSSDDELTESDSDSEDLGHPYMTRSRQQTCSDDESSSSNDSDLEN